jgi:hypothetical protein
MVAEQLPTTLGRPLLTVAQNAFVDGVQVTAIIGTVVMVGLAVLTATMLRHIGLDHHSEEQDDPEFVVQPPMSPVQTEVPCFDGQQV